MEEAFWKLLKHTRWFVNNKTVFFTNMMNTKYEVVTHFNENRKEGRKRERKVRTRCKLKAKTITIIKSIYVHLQDVIKFSIRKATIKRKKAHIQTDSKKCERTSKEIVLYGLCRRQVYETLTTIMTVTDDKENVNSKSRKVWIK